MNERRVLIVDDEADLRELVSITLQRMGLEPLAAADLESARGMLKHADLCLTDLRLPDGDGLELVQHIQRTCPQLPVAVITAHGSMEAAVRALKLGAYDFVSKPIDLKNLRDLVKNGLKLSHKPPPLQSAGDQLLGNSPTMRSLRASIAKLSRSLAPLCISGESGSGKERVAREVHRLSPRSDGPFLAVNCGAVPAELMESEFFGHVKGSFTGATADKLGLFQSASGGTLLLDEVADLPLAMQVKLLRAIQERAVRPVGAAVEIPVDVRIISATHKDLNEEVRKGRFRQDLYYRIHVIELHVPALREHVDDIPLLAAHFLSRIATQLGTGELRLSPEALTRLQSYRFPGNVRELENVLERAAALCEQDLIQSGDIQLQGAAPDEDESDAAAGDLEEQLDDQTRKAIVVALERTHWNRTAAARALGISLRQLRYRLKKLGLE